MNVKPSVNQRKVRKTAHHQSVNSIAQGVAKKAIEIDLLPVQPYYGTTEAAMPGLSVLPDYMYIP